MPRFDGVDYIEERDGERLSNQQERINAFVGDNNWHTLSEISRATGAPEASVSAALRNLRKEKFGGRTVTREYVDNGLYRYKLER